VSTEVRDLGDGNIYLRILSACICFAELSLLEGIIFPLGFIVVLFINY
jgi:hypothetical protein